MPLAIKKTSLCAISTYCPGSVKVCSSKNGFAAGFWHGSCAFLLSTPTHTGANGDRIWVVWTIVVDLPNKRLVHCYEISIVVQYERHPCTQCEEERPWSQNGIRYSTVSVWKSRHNLFKCLKPQRPQIVVGLMAGWVGVCVCVCVCICLF